MKKVILITSDDRIEAKDFQGYSDFNKLVNGYIEYCGYISICNIRCHLICNEEFLFLDQCEFNSIATLLAKQRIYGNLVIAAEGYTNDEYHELDSVPFEEDDCNKVITALQNYKKLHATEMIEARIRFSFNKPKPSAEIIAMTAEEFAKMFGLDED